ncbi:hypothetical protein EDB85DRAFT_1907955 [Lactarius pseudohatsudake]|nr:hypothetical protein EDB85DRAFT_1907955 [Lactarius pseudohatsudake]
MWCIECEHAECFKATRVSAAATRKTMTARNTDTERSTRRTTKEVGGGASDNLGKSRACAPGVTSSDKAFERASASAAARGQVQCQEESVCAKPLSSQLRGCHIQLLSTYCAHLAILKDCVLLPDVRKRFRGNSVDATATRIRQESASAPTTA